MRKLIYYWLAAVLAILINIGSQWAFVMTFGQSDTMVITSVLVGTITGFLAKYILDKVLVFEVAFEASGEEVRQFFFYGVTGVITTLIFWGTELGFHIAFEQEVMRYVGGVVGLCVGYCLKFVLDSMFVFRK
ncbi:MAG: GtrA family protein [Henriciella sp.]